MTLVGSIKENEGFMGMPYKDSLGKLTIGYGTLLPINEEEGELLLKYRLDKAIKELQIKKPYVKELPEPIQEVLYEMVYQLGVSKLMKFKRMWKAIEDRDWDKMIKEMRDSKWYKQTPNRVDKLIGKISDHKKN
ncbi:MAG TPA: hypothetical protein EYP80_02725 [Candidatus Aenigmarchaeota archaeon]|nr:hypothetical protein [Candidatus Aenigmarchaeota archaeon]